MLSRVEFNGLVVHKQNLLDVIDGEALQFSPVLKY